MCAPPLGSPPLWATDPPLTQKHRLFSRIRGASASEPEWSLALAVPGVRGWSGLPTALASGRGLRSQRARHLHGYHLTRSHSTTNRQLRKWDTPQSLNTTTSHTSPRASSTSRSAQAAVLYFFCCRHCHRAGAELAASCILVTPAAVRLIVPSGAAPCAGNPHTQGLLATLASACAATR